MQPLLDGNREGANKAKPDGRYTPLYWGGSQERGLRSGSFYVCVLLGSGAGVDLPMNTTSSDGLTLGSLASSPLLLVVRDLRLSTVLQRHLF